METKENLKDIPGFEGKLMISINGDAYTYPKKILRTHIKGKLVNAEINYKKRKLAICVVKAGYKMVATSFDGIRVNLYIHRAIALAFIPNPENKPCVNHKDGNKLNNSIDNLEWCTHQENMIHAGETGLLYISKRKQNI